MWQALWSGATDKSKVSYCTFYLSFLRLSTVPPPSCVFSGFNMSKVKASVIFDDKINLQSRQLSTRWSSQEANSLNNCFWCLSYAKWHLIQSVWLCACVSRQEGHLPWVIWCPFNFLVVVRHQDGQGRVNTKHTLKLTGPAAWRNNPLIILMFKQSLGNDSF